MPLRAIVIVGCWATIKCQVILLDPSPSLGSVPLSSNLFSIENKLVEIF